MCGGRRAENNRDATFSEYSIKVFYERSQERDKVYVESWKSTPESSITIVELYRLISHY